MNFHAVGRHSWIFLIESFRRDNYNFNYGLLRSNNCSKENVVATLFMKLELVPKKSNLRKLPNLAQTASPSSFSQNITASIIEIFRVEKKIKIAECRSDRKIRQREWKFPRGRPKVILRRVPKCLKKEKS